MTSVTQDDVQIRIELYITDSGQTPYADWLHGMRDTRSRGRIRARMNRVRLGNLGKWRPVGDGVKELIFDFGPGYRVYYGHLGITIILLLCAGDKSTQAADIITAKEYWADYYAQPGKESTHAKAN